MRISLTLLGAKHRRAATAARALLGTIRPQKANSSTLIGHWPELDAHVLASAGGFRVAVDMTVRQRLFPRVLLPFGPYPMQVIDVLTKFDVMLDNTAANCATRLASRA